MINPVPLSQTKVVVVNFSASGDNTLVAAAAGQLINVVRLFLVVGGATNLTFKDGTGGTALSGPIPMTANGSITLDIPTVSIPWFSTSNPVNNLVLNSSAAVQVSGTLWYTQK